MTTLVIILGFLAVIAALMAFELLSLQRVTPTMLDPTVLKHELSGLDAYRPMARLFSKDDVEYLSSRTGASAKMQRKLRSSRRKAMLLYLGEVRRDFRLTWGICRFLAPFSQDPDFGTLLVKQLVVFYGLYLAVSVRCLASSWGYGGALAPAIGNLVDVVASMHRAAIGALQATEGLASDSSAA